MSAPTRTLTPRELNRAGVAREDHRRLIFTLATRSRSAPSSSTGRWRGPWKLKDGRVQPEPFERLRPATRRAVDEEAERLSAFYA